MLSVVYAEGYLCWVSFIVANKVLILSFIIHDVVTKSVLPLFYVYCQTFATKILSLLTNDTFQWNEKKTLFLLELLLKKVGF